ncbi:DUF6599 family protein [Candidatus Eisenbacteria bacterium]|uniref:DUF6599 family protein n=1 Tax=Eiseniibacteriota bacterium TaxID=2212470 RepID=A0ABV6YJ23_UNCEI
MAQTCFARKSAIALSVAVILGTLGTGTMADDSVANLGRLVETLPSDLAGWDKSEKYEVYSAANLFKYINGGAELYISYQFENLLSQLYVRGETGEIKIDIFDMGSSFSAYGIFAHSRESVDNFVSPQVESEYGGGLLTFWKGRYYVSILAYPETDEKRTIVRTIAQHIAEQIKGDSKKPGIIFELPMEGLDPNSVRYFQHHAWINTYRFISNENILNIDADTEVAMAKYKTAAGGAPTVLILLQYPDPARAQTARDSFRHGYMADTDEKTIQSSDQSWTCCEREENRVLITLGSPDRGTAEELVKEAIQQARHAKEEG